MKGSVYALTVALGACASHYSAPDTHPDSGTESGSDGSPMTTDAGVAPLAGCATAPTITGAAGTAVTTWKRQTGSLAIDYYGAGTASRDVTQFASVFTSPAATAPVPWPSSYGLAAAIPLPEDRYLSLELTVPAGFFESEGTTLVNGDYSNDPSGESAPYSITISTYCGDFGQITPTTIPPGCTVNKIFGSGLFRWGHTPNQAVSCDLVDGVTYYLNIINADISTLPTAGTASSTEAGVGGNCTDGLCCKNGLCSDSIENGPGTWHP